jgi:hypothetical protein
MKMSQAYSDPSRESDPHALPDVEVFFVHSRPSGLRGPEAEEMLSEGWYWWSCFPGCMPDGEPNGPYATEAEALADAQEQS